MTSRVYLVAACALVAACESPSPDGSPAPSRAAQTATSGLVLEASKTYSPSTWFHDERNLDRPVAFAVPAELPVTVGNAGNHTATLRFRRGGDIATCEYRGGADQAHPSGDVQIEKGLRYLLRSCSDGSDAGDTVTTDYVRLSVGNGDSWSPTRDDARTTIRVALTDAAADCAVPAWEQFAPGTSVVLGDASITRTGWTGPLWIGGDVTTQNVGFRVTDGSDALTVVGQATLRDGSVRGGDLVTKAAPDLTRFEANSSRLVDRTALDDVADSVAAYADTLSALAPTGTSAVASDQLLLSGTGVELEVIDVDAHDLDARRITVESTAHTVIARVIGGASATIDRAVFQTGSPDQAVIWFFPATDAVTVKDTRVLGDLIAPNAAVRFERSGIVGSVVAGELSTLHLGRRERATAAACVAPGRIPDSAPDLDPSTTLAASASCAGADQPGMLTLDQADAPWVLPGALRVTSPGATAATLSHGEPAVECRYGPSASNGYLELESCSDGAIAGAEIASTSVSLSVSGTACAPGQARVAVQTRVLPAASGQSDEPLRLRLTPATVSLTEVGQQRRIAVRGFVGDREVAVGGLGLTLETFGDDATAELLPDGSIRVTAVASPGYAAVGVRATGHPGAPTSGALVTSAPLRDHVIELRGGDVAHPALGVVGVDPAAGGAGSSAPFGVGPFALDDLVPAEDAPDIPRHTAVVRAAAAGPLEPGAIFALTDGHALQGIVLETERRADLVKVVYMPLSVPQVYEAMDVRYSGELAAAGYTWDAFTAVEMDTIRTGPITVLEDTGDGLVAPAGASAAAADACDAEVQGGLGSLSFSQGVRPFPLANDFVLRFDSLSERYDDPRVERLIRLLPPTARLAELLSFRLAEFRVRMATRVEYFLAAEARIQASVSFSGSCDVFELLGGGSGADTTIPGPFGLAVRLQTQPKLEFDITGNGGPEFVFRHTYSRQWDSDFGFELGNSVPGGMRPHPDIVDLNGDGQVRYYEALTAPAENNQPPIIEGDWGIGAGGTEPVFAIQAEIGLEVETSAALTFGPGLLLASALDYLVQAGELTDAAARTRAFAAVERAAAILKPIFEEGIISARTSVGAALRFGIESSGSLLNTSFDNTTYLCNEVNRLGLQFDVVAFEVSVLGGLDDALAELFTPAGILSTDFTLFTFSLPPIGAVSFHTCQNPAFGTSTQAVVRRDSRECGNALAPGETATFEVIETFSQNDALELLGPKQPPRETGVYLQEPQGGLRAWRRIDDGALPRTGTSGDVHDFAGEFELTSEQAQLFDGDQEVRLLTHTRMIGVIPTVDQQASIMPACGCRTDDDCVDATCDVPAGALVGTCDDGPPVYTVFQANGLVFQAPGTNQAIVGTDCESPVARNVTLRGIADAAVLNTGATGRTITAAELRLDGAVIASQLPQASVPSVELTAPPRDLEEGTYSLSLVLSGLEPDGVGTWTDTITATFPVVVDVDDCECPTCEELNAECGSLQTTCGVLQCGSEPCQCVGNTCVGPRECERGSTWNPATGTCDATCDGTQVVSGGDGPVVTFPFPVTPGGNVSVSRTFFTIKDRIRVLYEGQVLLDSGCTGGSSTTNVSLPAGTATQALVELSPTCDPNESSTAWRFSVSCN